MFDRKRGGVLLVLAAAMGAAPSAFAADSGLAGEIERLRAEIAAQQKAIADQQAKITAQQRLLQKLEARVLGQAGDKPGLGTVRGAGAPAAAASPSDHTAADPGPGDQRPVGVAPRETPKERPEVQVLSDLGGILTPAGHITFEPSFEYANQQFNQFFFSGLEVVNAVFIGGINATNARRNTLTAALNTRYGITSRLEASVKIPYVYRADRVFLGPATGSTNVLNADVSGADIGDVEFGLHYQLNVPTNGGAYYVANLRVKTDTGTGPFDVPYNIQGQQTRLPTGSGFWSAEPSLTVLYPNDPVVLFGNIGYSLNIGTDVNKRLGIQNFGRVEPGDILRASAGLGFSINERVSLSLGYEHDWVLETESIINGARATSDQLQLGSFLAGISYAFSPMTSGNFNIALGATRDAPDVRILFTLPMTFDLLK